MSRPRCPSSSSRSGSRTASGCCHTPMPRTRSIPPSRMTRGMKDWRAWMSKYLPGEDVRRPSFVNGYNSAATMVQVLKQAGDDLSRENIMRQATNLRDLELPMLLPGIKVNTSPTDYYPVLQLQLVRFDGKRWVRFGDLVYDE